MFKALDVLMPSFRSPELTEVAVRSFIRSKPGGMQLNIVVVENSDDTSYRDRILELRRPSVAVSWLQNPTQERESRANAEALDLARQLVTSPWVFLTHNDVCVVCPGFYDEMARKAEAGFHLVGTVRDPTRVNAIHVSGYLIETDLLRSIDLWPVVEGGVQTHDVGDKATVACRARSLPHYCFKNTFNDPNLRAPYPFTDLHVDRCLGENGNVIFMHLGRGTPKTLGTYQKPNRVYLPEWITSCDRILGD